MTGCCRLFRTTQKRIAMAQTKEKTVPASIKVPPHNMEAEQAILGGILINNDAMNQIMDILSPECFYREAHMHLYEGMISLYNNDEPVDLITLSQHLNQKNLLEKAGGADYLASLVDAVSTSAGISFHAEIVGESSLYSAQQSPKTVFRTGTLPMNSLTLPSSPYLTSARKRSAKAFPLLKTSSRTVLKSWKACRKMKALSQAFLRILRTLTALRQACSHLT
jgi:hypothetical protein